jgi:hypothetical protein
MEDRLIDVFVAAEALYLTDIGDTKDRSGMRYRLALRAALWLDGDPPGWSQRQVFRQMKVGYDVRSAIVHGGSPDPRDLRVKGQRAPLDEVVEACETIVKGGLRRAFRQMTATRRPFRVQWEDDLIFSDEHAPED